MSWTNYDDVRGQLLAAGLLVDALQVDTHKAVRCKVDGAGREKRGWYRLFTHGDILTGAYGIWSANDPQTFKVSLPADKRRQLTADELAAIKARQKIETERADAERAREIEQAAQKAGRWWRQLLDAGHSGYMAKKGFAGSELFGARISPSGNLVIPVQDTVGRIWGLQVVYPTKEKNGRDKDFAPSGLAKKGHFFQMGAAARGSIILICEGFATGASLHKATGLPVVVAFDAGNLLPVALEIHKAHRKDIKILVCADDDYQTEARTGKNPGRDAAKAAALAVDGAVVWPVFPTERPTDKKGPTDFNDLHCDPAGGLQAVRSGVEAAISSAGWRLRGTEARADAPHSGRGEDRRAQAVMPLDDLVERFISIDDGTGKYVWDTWTNKIANRDQMITMLQAGVRGDDIKRHPVWMSRAYFLDQIGFDPSGDDSAVKLNTWQGWPMAPVAGSCERLLDLLRYLCGDEVNSEEVYHWLLCWMAYPLQRPGAKMNSAVIMHGPQGTGKSAVFQAYAKIYGDYSITLNQRGIEDKFNSDWADSKLFILAEEVVTRAEMWHIKNELKELVTGEWIRVNPKNIAAYRQRNHINVVYLSNENQPLPLENDDRRHLVVYTPPAMSEAYYDQVFQEIENGGIEALYDYLLHLDLGEFHPKKRPPMTEAKKALIALSSPSETRFILEYGAGELGLPVCPAKCNEVYATYLKWCRQNGEGRPRPSNQFWGAVTRSTGWLKTKARVFDSLEFHGDGKPTHVLIPPADMIDRKHAFQEGTSQSRWVTECCVAFNAAITPEQQWASA